MIDVSKFVSGVAYKAAPSLKCSAGFSIDPVSAGAGVVSSLISGIMGNKAQKSANQTNIQIARETNAANKEMLESQQQFALDSWNRENEYNLPVNQVERLRAAGINPSAVFGNGSTSEAGSIDNPAASPMQGATVQAEDAMAQGIQSAGHAIGNSINAYYQNQLLNAQKIKTDAEANNVDLLAQMTALDKASQIAQRMDEMRRNGQMHTIAYATAEQQYNELMATWDTRKSMLEGDYTLQQKHGQLLDEQIRYTQLQQQALEIANEYAPKLAGAQLQHFQAMCYELQASADKMMAEKGYIDTQELGARLDNGMKAIDYKAHGSFVKATINNIVQNARKTMFEGYTEYMNQRELKVNAGLLGSFGIKPRVGSNRKLYNVW